MEVEFLGHTAKYWLELQRRVDEEINAPRLLEEIVELRSKISLYESRIEEMYMVMNRRPK